jgi:hypothetical protein
MATCDVNPPEIMNDEDLFRSFLVNFEKGFPSDDEDDEVYKPEEPSDDDDDPIVDAGQDSGPSQAAIDLARIFKRFEDTTRLPANQIFLTPCPLADELPGSHFSVPQWDALRMQCRLHFGLLVRSVRYVSLCASSVSILQGLLAMIYSFSETWSSAVELSAQLNALFDRELFVPVMGDGSNSPIRFAKEILEQFRQGAVVDDVIDTPVFKEVLDIVPLNDETRPMNYITHAPWSAEETALCEVASARFHTPQEMQKYVIPGRSIITISGYFRKEWNAGQRAAKNPPPKQIVDEVAKQAAVVDQQDPDEPFVLDHSMKFAVVTELPPDLPSSGP